MTDLTPLSTVEQQAERIRELEAELKAAVRNRRFYADERTKAEAKVRELEAFTKGWHDAVDAICTIVGANNGLGASEAVVAVRERYAAAQQALETAREGLEQIAEAHWGEMRSTAIARETLLKLRGKADV